MQPIQLTRDERVACIALVKYMVFNDGFPSATEARRVQLLRGVFGESELEELWTTTKVLPEEELKESLATVERQEARSFIFGTAMEVAFEDGVQAAESSLLDWLQAQWNVAIESA